MNLVEGSEPEIREDEVVCPSCFLTHFKNLTTCPNCGH